MEIPENIFICPTHEYIREENGVYYVGISEILANKLGYIVHAELPNDIGGYYLKKEVFATLESSSLAAEIHMPVTGKILEVNPVLKDNSGIINSEPYTEGWILKIEPTNYEDDSFDFQDYRFYIDNN